MFVEAQIYYKKDIHKKNWLKSLFNKLKEKRLQAGYTQKDVAGFLNVSLRTYIYYETTQWPPHKELLKLNKLFKYDFSIHIYGNKTTKR